MPSVHCLKRKTLLWLQSFWTMVTEFMGWMDSQFSEHLFAFAKQAVAPVHHTDDVTQIMAQPRISFIVGITSTAVCQRDLCGAIAQPWHALHTGMNLRCRELELLRQSCVWGRSPLLK